LICQPIGAVKHVYITHAPDSLSLTAFVEFETAEAVLAAKRKLDGANIYDGCCLISVRASAVRLCAASVHARVPNRPPFPSRWRLEGRLRLSTRHLAHQNGIGDCVFRWFPCALLDVHVVRRGFAGRMWHALVLIRTRLALATGAHRLLPGTTRTAHRQWTSSLAMVLRGARPRTPRALRTVEVVTLSQQAMALPRLAMRHRQGTLRLLGAAAAAAVHQCDAVMIVNWIAIVTANGTVSVTGRLEIRRPPAAPCCL
jgi:hypothetical protein